MSTFGPLMIDRAREKCESCGLRLWPVSVLDLVTGETVRHAFAERMFKPVEHTPERCRARR